MQAFGVELMFCLYFTQSLRMMGNVVCCASLPPHKLIKWAAFSSKNDFPSNVYNIVVAFMCTSRKQSFQCGLKAAVVKIIRLIMWPKMAAS